MCIDPPLPLLIPAARPASSAMTNLGYATSVRLRACARARPLARVAPRRAPGQFGQDPLGVDAVSQHVAMVAIAGDDAVLADGHRRLKPDRHRFLADIEVAEPPD